MSTDAVQPAMVDGQFRLLSTFSAEADDERNFGLSSSPSSADPDVAPESIYNLTDNKYIPISSAGAGTCAQLFFCITVPEPRQTPELVVIKMPSDPWHCLKLANEIKALSQIRNQTKSLDNAKHFPKLLSYTFFEVQDCRWLSLAPIYGFSLYQLRCVVQPFITPSSVARNPHLALQLPRVLIFHIATQLMRVVDWLHQQGITHGDIFDGNVMLEVEHGGDCAKSWAMPTVVLIDFDAASLNPSDAGNVDDRAFVFELLGGLCRLASPDDDISYPGEEILWWGELRCYLAAIGVRSRHSSVPSFAMFRERFAEEMYRRLEGITETEGMRVNQLIQHVMASEVRFPSEDDIEQALRKWRGEGTQSGK